MTRWRPTFVGAFKIPSVLAMDTDVIAYRDGSIGKREFLLHRLTGSSPRLTRILRQLQPAVIHAHFGGDGWLISRSAVRLGIPLVVTLHGHDVTRQPNSRGLKGIRYRRNLRTMFQRATVVLAVSEHIRQQAISLGADPAKVRVHHTGIPMQPASTPVAKEWDVIFVGRFVEKKGTDDLIEALGTLSHVRPRALFIGDGPLEQQVRDRAEALGVEATFLGAQDHATVRRHMAASKIFASPSKTAADGNTEGLPTTILEAASLGVPTVSTYHSGIPDAVVDGETGLLGAEGDRSALADAIRRLLGDDDLRTRLGANARRYVETNFDLAERTRVLESLYDAVSNGRAALDRVDAPAAG